MCFVATLEMSVRAFLVDHMSLLQDTFELSVICSTEDPEFLETQGVKARVIPVAISRRISPVSDVKTLLALLRIFREERFDIVHSIMPKSGLAGLLAMIRLRRPCVVREGPHLYGTGMEEPEGLQRRCPQDQATGCSLPVPRRSSSTALPRGSSRRGVSWDATGRSGHSERVSRGVDAGSST